MIPPPPPRAIVRDYRAGTRSFDVVFDARTSYDFLISLIVPESTGQDILPEDHRWLERARATLPQEVRSDFEACFRGEDGGVHSALPLLLVERPDLSDAASFVDAFESMSIGEITRELFRDTMTEADGAALLERVIDGDAEAIPQLLARVPDKEHKSALDFLTDPAERIARIRGVVRAWLPLYQEVESRVARILHRDVADRIPDRASLDPSTLIENTTGGLRWLPEPNVRRAVMAPSYFGRPYNHLFSSGDWRLFCYPVADAALGATDPTVPPPAMVRLHRALGDPTRMRVLRLLADRDWYLTELATQLELSKPTMKHHLAQLRAAGLVIVTDEGTLTYYSLRRERIEQAGEELKRYLS